MTTTLRVTRPPVQVLPDSALLGKAVKLGGVKMNEVKLSPALKRHEAELQKFAETGDGQGVSAWRLTKADARELAASAPKLRSVLFDALTGADESDPSERAGWYEGGKYTEVKTVDRAKAFSALAKTFQSDEGSATDHPDRAKLHGAIRAFLPSFLGDADTRLFRVVQHDNGYGFYSGVAAFNARTGELKLAMNSYAP